MFCAMCGNKVNAGDRFCGKCGNKIMSIDNRTEKETAEFISDKCINCGAAIKRLSKTRYMCEYCVSEYHTADDGRVTEKRILEKDLMEVIYAAAKWEVQNKVFEELQCLLTIKEQADDNAFYLVKLGRAYRRNGMNGKAVECYEKALEINPDYAAAYANLGAIYILSNQPAAAEDRLRRAITLMNDNRISYTDDDYAIAWAMYAVAVGKLGRIDEAKKYLKIAKENGYKYIKNAKKMIGI